MAIAEFKEFFLRNTNINTGSKPDQEVGISKSYIVKGISVFNSFLAESYPNEYMFRKLFASIAFKLNPEDTGTTSVQGLVKKASDLNAEGRINNPSTDITTSVVTHQLPEVVLITDGNDSNITTIIKNGISLSIIRRTITGYFRKNFLVSTAIQQSITNNNGGTERLSLVGDVDTPGKNKSYSTDSNGTRGWYSTTGLKMLLNDFSKVSDTTLVTIGSSPNDFSFPVITGKNYKFEAYFLTACDSSAGLKFSLSGVTSSFLIYQIDYSDNNLTANFRNVRSAYGSDTFTGSVRGVCKITGTIIPSASGNLSFNFSQAVSSVVSSTIKEGSFASIVEITGS